jgi:hypothetical protein
MWIRGPDHKIAICLQRPFAGNSYQAHISLYLDRDSTSLADGSEDSFFPASLLLGDDGGVGFKALSSETGQWIGSEEERASAITRMLIDRLVPIGHKMGSREGILEVVCSHGLESYLTVWVREHLGIADKRGSEDQG